MKKLVVMVALLGGCGAAPSYGAPYVALRPPVGRQSIGPVRGDDCSFHVAGAQSRATSAATAIEHALEGTNAQGIVNAQVRTVTRAPFEVCIEVEGIGIE